MLPHEIMKLPRFSLPALLFCIPVLVTSCGTGGRNAPLPPASSTPVEELTGYFEGKGTIPGHLLKWEDDPSLPGKLLIVVDKKKQMMYVYRGTHRIAYAPITGPLYRVTEASGTATSERNPRGREKGLSLPKCPTS